MVFECGQCGECCSHLGLVFEIIETYDSYSFRIRNQYTGKKQVVSVAPQLSHLYDDRKIFVERPEACPFFRMNDQDHLSYCTVHLTRPDICREYGCWRFLILDPLGNRAGRVMQSRHLDAENPRLRQVWDTYIDTMHEPDDQEWDRKMSEIVRRSGFQIIE
ncbi:MAG TPA: YkgJ family cysteine cluster protein [Methanospirillum sp.]|nr:YkgJ family cysteine cluster protein [Methanospirillum sp.]